MKGNKNHEPVKKCTLCTKEKRISHFYNSNSKLSDGKSPMCKNCIKSKIDYNDITTIHSILRTLDIPFNIEYWEKAIKSKKDPFGSYMRMANSLRQFQGLTWDDSNFEKENDNNIAGESVTPIKEISSQKIKVTNELLEKWGTGYDTEEYLQFERKYQALKNNYPERTAMHTEALLTYIRYRVKEELATAQGNAKAAKDWGTLAKDAATAAKINPSQLSKADLLDGLDSFSQLTRSVEQAVDIIDILPRFKEKPQDKPDFTIWCYVNYIRDLKGLPLAEYRDVYRFYEERKREYELNNEDDEYGIL